MTATRIAYVEDVGDRSLASRLGWLLRVERERAGLSQEMLAARAGVAQQAVSRFEAGATGATTTLVDRLFSALGCHLQIVVGARGADLDRQIAEVRAGANDRRIGRMLDNLHHLLRRAPDLRHLLDGELAAALQGVPLLVTRYDLAVAADDLDQFADWVRSSPNWLRWSERWRDFSGYDVDPRRPGPLRWMTPFGELRARLLLALPTGVPVMAAGREVRVRPLFEVEQDDPRIARIVARAAKIRANGPGQTRSGPVQSTVGSGGPSTSSASTIV